MPWWCWWLGLLALWTATFGFWMTIVPPLMFIAFAIGAAMHFFWQTKQPFEGMQEASTSEVPLKSGIRKILEDHVETPPRSDKRLTGSQVIDEHLHEIIGYLLRDFVLPWYRKLSNDDEFEFRIKESLQKVFIIIAGKMKDVEWIPYLTTRLVDEAATHLKLYRLVCEKIKAETAKKSTPQSLASFKSAAEGGHSRNNSDGGGKIKTHSRNSSIGERPTDFDSMFFHIEAEQENILRHEKLCMNREEEKAFLNDVVDVILYLVLPREDFRCVPVRNLLRSIVTGGILLPLIDALSEPDCINRTMVWLCSEFGITNESFVATLRMTTDYYELMAMQEFVAKELNILRSRFGGEVDIVKQQIKSLMYIKKVIDNKLKGGSDTSDVIAPEKLVQLSLSEILSNSLALSFFIDYLSTVDKQNYVFLHLAIESWRSSLTSEKQKNDGKLNKSQIQSFRETAHSVYQQYLSEKSAGRFKIDQPLETRFLAKMSHEPPAEIWFDEVQNSLRKKMTDQVLPDFYRSNIYLKLLSELELLKEEDESPDNVSLTGSLEDDDVATSSRTAEPSTSSKKAEAPTAAPKIPAEFGVGKFNLKVGIVDSGVVQDRGKTYGMYALNVVKTYENGFTTQWHVYRRYSDFYDLQQKVKDNYSDLGKLPFPGKKTFNNMGPLTIAKRMKMLNDYLQILLHSGVAETHPKLPGLLLFFLEPGEYDKAFTFGSALESVVGPIKSSMRTVSAAVRTVPDNLFHSPDTRKKDPRDETVPVRILLLLMDEVFELQSRNQWLRRRIVTLLRQIFGDMFTRKMLDYVEELTGAAKVAGYINSVKEMLWPNGFRTTGPGESDETCRRRTRVLAKASLLSAADDFKHLLGSDTMRRGVFRVFNTFQNPVINRRLVHVLLEGVLELIFPPLIDIHLKLLETKKKFN